jgi:hypothetical protein
MFGSEILEVAIGVIVVFLLVSIICTAVREAIETKLKTRAAHLEHAIRELLHDRDADGLASHVYRHPLIYALFPGEYQPTDFKAGPPGALTRGGDLPSYIPSRSFSMALMDIAVRGPVANAATSGSGAAEVNAENVRASIQNIVNPAVQRVLLTALDEAQGDFDRARKNVEAWFDSSMDRISGHYKRASQRIIFWIGLVVAVLMNVNAIRVAEYLYTHDAARAVVVAQAEKAAGDSTYLERTYGQARTDLEALPLPLGWKGVDFGRPGTVRTVKRVVNGETRKVPVMLTVWVDGRKVSVPVRRSFWEYVLSPVLGWLMVAFAATLGAPFWFDVLNKVMVIRSTVKPNEKSPNEASEDRQIRPVRKPAAGGEGGEVPAGGGGTTGGGGGTPGGGGGGTAGGGGGDTPGGPVDPDRDPALAADEELDGCDALHAHPADEDERTADEELPQAEGGVA